MTAVPATLFARSRFSLNFWYFSHWRKGKFKSALADLYRLLLMLNEIAWSPGDPGTGAPSFFAAVMPGICVRPLATLAA
jgi:hypothetical protein